MRRVSLGILALVAACIGVYGLCVIPFRANLAIRDIEERTEAARNMDPHSAALQARTNLAALERIARSEERNPAWYLLYGANCELLNRWESAASSYTRALAIDQRPEIYFNRGLALLRLGRIEEATRDLTMAVRFNPTYLDRVDGELRARVAAAAGLS